MYAIPDILYNYCSNETFLSIITNRVIRLSDIGKSNDYKEVKVEKSKFTFR